MPLCKECYHEKTCKYKEKIEAAAKLLDLGEDIELGCQHFAENPSIITPGCPLYGEGWSGDYVVTTTASVEPLNVRESVICN